MEFKKAYLIAPSGFVNKKNLKIAEDRLMKIGFNSILYSNSIFFRYFDYAGIPLRRYNEINEAYSSDASVIFSIIGGMSAIHTLPHLNYTLIKKSGKILIGCSDVTILLNSIHQRTNARCLHGPNIGNEREMSEKTFLCLVDVIHKRNYSVLINKKDILVKGSVEADIIGGNLELIGRSLGTPFEICTQGKILFLEDFKMKSWRINDILWQLKLAGKFEQVKGIILGKFIKCGKNTDFYLKEFFNNFKCPVILNQPIGHGDPNLTIPIGEKCIIDTERGFWKIRFS